MQEPTRTVVTFKSRAFNSSVPKATFVNPECFGDDLAAWLGGQLRARGLEADEQPGAEDFGWYLRFSFEGVPYCAVVGYRPDDGPDGGDWVVWLERDAGFLASLLGRRDKGIRREAALLLHDVLSASGDLQHVRWHSKRDFDAGREDRASPAP
ncbi:MAG: hypothetical protein M3O34_00415 [Chloroflexota bacterium]|nr:hypothetical protein [Chloroflexota bacterium]